MPKRTDIHKILIIGSGPIVVGQACESDYSGTPACRALKQESFQNCFSNSNPATIDRFENHRLNFIKPLIVETFSAILKGKTG